MDKADITVQNIIPSQRKNSRWSTTVEEFYSNKKERWNATISGDKKSITIFGKNYMGNDFSKTFKVGDYTEYGSFNLIYYGKIVKISDKSVTIEEKYGDRKHRLDLYKFCYRNYDFDLDEVCEKNADTMMYI